MRSALIRHGATGERGSGKPATKQVWALARRRAVAASGTVTRRTQGGVISYNAGIFPCEKACGDQLVCGRAGSQWKHLARSGGRSWSPILSGTLWQASCEKRGAKLEPTSVESSGPASCEKRGAKLEPSISGSSVRSLLREAGGEAGAQFSRELWASFVREVGGVAGTQYLSYNAGINSCEKGKTGSGSKDCQACQPCFRPSFSDGQ